jgi:hypothetical protein
MQPASQQLLERNAHVLVDLGAHYGLSDFQRAGDGTLVATVAQGRTYIDIVLFEAKVEELLNATVDVVPVGAEAAARSAQGPLIPALTG